MSLERLKKYCERIAKISKILTVIMVILIACQTLLFTWQALMPGKLNGFFNVFRIYAPFISNIDNNALCLYELGGSLFNNLFIFVMLTIIRKMFLRLSENVSLSSVTHEMKVLASILIADAIAVPVVKAICYNVFIKALLPAGIIDLCPVIIGALMYFIAIIIQSKAVLRENQE